MSSALFVALVLPVLAGVHYYVWRRTVRDTTAPGSLWRRVGTVLIVLLGLLLVAAPPGERALPATLATAVGWPGFLWMAGILYLSLALLVGELLRLFLLRVERRRVRAALPVETGARSMTGGEPAHRTDSAPSATDTPQAASSGTDTPSPRPPRPSIPHGGCSSAGPSPWSPAPPPPPPWGTARTPRSALPGSSTSPCRSPGSTPRPTASGSP